MAPQPGDLTLGTIQACTLGAEPITPLPVAGVRFAGLRHDQEEDLAAAMGIDVAEVRHRLADAGSAVVALADGQIAAYGWVLYGMVRIPDLRLRVPLPAGHAYIWDCLTLPPYRGRGVFPALLRYLLDDLQARGVRQAWAATAPGNGTSMRAFARAGFRLVAYTSGYIGTFVAQPTAQATPEEATLLRESFPG